MRRSPRRTADLRQIAAGALALVALAAATVALGAPAAARPTARAVPQAFVDDVIAWPDGADEEIVVDAEGRFLVHAVVDGTLHLWRYLASGDLDPTFGDGGAVTLASERYVELLPRSDGSVTIVDSSWEGVVFSQRYRHVLESGAVDGTYGVGGELSLVAPLSGEQVAHVADGALLVLVIRRGEPVTLHRLDPDGQPDPGYGDAGVVEVLCCGDPDRLVDISPWAEADGSALLSGWTGTEWRAYRVDPSGTVVADQVHTSGYWAPVGWFDDGSVLVQKTGGDEVRRWRADLTEDLSFGEGGVMSVPDGTARWAESGGHPYLAARTDGPGTPRLRVVEFDTSGVADAWGEGVELGLDPELDSSVDRVWWDIEPDGRGGVLVHLSAYFNWGVFHQEPPIGRLWQLGPDGQVLQQRERRFIGRAVALPDAGVAVAPVELTSEHPSAHRVDAIERFALVDHRVAPFPSVAAFAEQVAQDVEGRSATPAEIAAAEAAIAGGGSAADLVLAAVGGERWSSRLEPVVRLYVAYFGRLPDPSGLRYWMGRRDAGLTVARISAVFADSSEFRSTYGSLTNRQFVELVYRNVLDREGDAAGIAFWTGRLDRRVTSRGHLMASFSESSEYRRATGPLVAVVGLFQAMLGRPPVSAEVDAWTPRDPAELAAWLLASDEYAARVNAG